MASKKSKFSPWNDSDKVLTRIVDTTREMPKAKKGLPEAADSNTFTVKDGGYSNGKKRRGK
jgi:hypothetical protein